MALAVGLLAATLAAGAHERSGPSWVSGDLTWWWRAARAVSDGQSPYAVIRPTGVYPFDGWFPYPLTNALAFLPLAPLRPMAAHLVFAAVSGALLGWAVTRDGYQRLPLVLSPAFVWCAETGQWAILLTAAALMPSLAWLATVKPNIGLAAFAYRPTWWTVAANVAALGACFAVRPAWVAEWIEAIRLVPDGAYRAPVVLWAAGGPLLLLALLRWRRPEARLLVVMACVPQSFKFYDQLLLWLVPATFLEAALLTGGAWVARFVWGASAATAIGASGAEQIRLAAQLDALGGVLLVLAVYLPCALMILARPNDADVTSRDFRTSDLVRNVPMSSVRTSSAAPHPPPSRPST